MKPFLYIALLLLSTVAHAQTVYTFKGYRDERCQLKVNADSTITNVTQTSSHTLYVETVGRIKRLTDTTYQVSDTALFVISLFENDGPNNKSAFAINVSNAFPLYNDISSLILQYSDKTKKQVTPVKGTFTTISIDKSRFNKKHSLMTLLTAHHNPISKEEVFLSIPSRSSVSFSAGETTIYQLLIRGNKVKPIGEPLFGPIPQ